MKQSGILRLGFSMVLLLAMVFCVAGNAAADAVPTGWTCTGNCGSTTGADGVVTLSPTGNSSFQWVSTTGGLGGVGVLPTGAIGGETNGSTLATTVFSASAGTALNFYFDYVTSDGSGFADYAYAELFTSTGTPSALLFTARTEASGSIVPGLGMPAPLATLTPPSVPIIPGGPVWSSLGTWSGTCYADGCGYTGWVGTTYVIPTDGDYYLQIGAVNALDTIFDSGLAMDGVTVGGVPIIPPTSTPEPASLSLLALGLSSVGLLRRKKKLATA